MVRLTRTQQTWLCFPVGQTTSGKAWNSNPQLVKLLGRLWNVSSCEDKVRARHTLTQTCCSTRRGEDSDSDLLQSQQQLRGLQLSTCTLRFTTMTFASSKELVTTRWKDQDGDCEARTHQTVRLCWESLPLVTDSQGRRETWTPRFLVSD